MRKITWALSLLLVSPALSAPALSATIYDEAVNGDLSNINTAPTILNFSPGQNIVRGSTGNPAGTTDRDYFTFTVPATLTLASLVLNNLVLGSGGGSGLAIQAGPQLTVPPPGSFADVGVFLGYGVPTPADIGTNILPSIGTAFGAIGFPSVLGQGTYTVWFQDTSPGETTYDMSFNISLPPPPGVAPEPASLIVLTTGLVGLLLTRRQQVCATP